MATTGDIGLQEIHISFTEGNTTAPNELQPRSTMSFRGETDESPQGVNDTEEPEPEWRPSRRYQTILLIAGFTMIFHVIGINSVYGVFQVCESSMLQAHVYSQYLGILHILCN